MEDQNQNRFGFVDFAETCDARGKAAPTVDIFFINFLLVVITLCLIV